MSRVNCWSSGSGQSDHFEDGVQKEALKEMIMDILHHELKPDFEILVRNTVREEFRNLLKGLDRNFGDQVHISEPRCLKLQFLKNVSLPVFTNEDIQGEGPSSIEVALVDNLNEKVVDYGPEAFAKVELIAVDGDGGGAMGDDWTAEDFNSNIVREREGAYSKGKKNTKREGKKPLLDGDVHLRLNKGLGVVGKVKFRQYTRWMKNQKFKLGVRVLDSFSGVRIREAMTKPFIVRDRRTKCERKRGSPSLLDDVSKLKNITKNGKRHKDLQKKNINTVEDFLIQLFKDPGHLEQMLGLEGNSWEVTVKHAQKCATDKRICYYYSSQQKIGVVFNVIEQVLGLISGCKYSPVEDLSEKDKVDARLLAISAFDHWQDVHQFHDLNSLLEYIDKLPTTTEETSNLSKLLIPHEDYTPFQDICPSIDSSAQESNIEDVGLSSADNVEHSQEMNINLSGDDYQVDARLLAISAFDHWQDLHQFHDLNSLLEYIDKLPTTIEETSNLSKLLIPHEEYTPFQDICPSIDSLAQESNIEDVGLSSADNVEHSQEMNINLSGDDYQSPNCGSTDDLMDFVENYFMQQKKAQKSWKKLSMVVRISMKKW